MKPQNGQALLLLLVAAAIALSIMTTGAALSVLGARSLSRTAQAYEALALAEAGVEDGIRRLLHDPSSSGTVTVPIGTSTITVTISGSGTKTIRAQASSGTLTRTLEADASWTQGKLSITRWEEID